MIASDLRNIADTAEMRARFDQPLGVAELIGLAVTLRSLADRAAVLESLPVPKQHRFTVIQGAPKPEGMFRDHRCWKCNDGAKPCTQGHPRQCEYPHARND